jgi:hypothetical protein
VALCHQGKNFGTYEIGAQVNIRASLDYAEKRKLLSLLGLNFEHSLLQPVDSSHTGCTTKDVDNIMERKFNGKFAILFTTYLPVNSL